MSERNSSIEINEKKLSSFYDLFLILLIRIIRYDFLSKLNK